MPTFTSNQLLLISDRRNLHRDSRCDTEQNVPCHTLTISNTYNTYFQCYCGSNISSETANLEHRLTWKVASLSPHRAHVKAVTKLLPKNGLKS